MKVDFSKLDELVDLMETGDLAELEVVDGERSYHIERMPVKKARKVEVERKDSLATVTSSRVGIFSCKVSAGSSVKAGAALGEIRMMDVTYTVSSPTEGVVEEIFVENGVAVEYGQPLMRVEPEE